MILPERVFGQIRREHHRLWPGNRTDLLRYVLAQLLARDPLPARRRISG